MQLRLSWVPREFINKRKSVIRLNISNYTNRDKSSMDPTSNLHQDSILQGFIKDINTETPRQDPQKTCTRNSPCLQQGCLTCSTPTNHVCNLDLSPTNHVRNLDVALNSINGPPNSATSLTSPTAAELPQPPTNHIISLLTTAYQLTIQDYKHRQPEGPLPLPQANNAILPGFF